MEESLAAVKVSDPAVPVSCELGIAVMQVLQRIAIYFAAATQG
jgi:hypothetical protein